MEKSRQAEIQDREIKRIRLMYQIMGEMEISLYLASEDRLTSEDIKILRFYTYAQLVEKAKSLGIKRFVDDTDMYR